jgi:hypothetical protein
MTAGGQGDVLEEWQRWCATTTLELRDDADVDDDVGETNY